MAVESTGELAIKGEPERTDNAFLAAKVCMGWRDGALLEKDRTLLGIRSGFTVNKLT